jgi:hypothetical protein
VLCASAVTARAPMHHDAMLCGEVYKHAYAYVCVHEDVCRVSCELANAQDYQLSKRAYIYSSICYYHIALAAVL